MIETTKEHIESKDPNQAQKNYQVCAKIFEKYGLYLEAAKSYYSCKKYEKAKELFVKINSWSEAGETMMIIIKEEREKNATDQVFTDNLKKMYQNAIEYFTKSDKYNKAIECCDLIKDYKQMVGLFIGYEQNINNFNYFFEIYFKKYLEELEIELKNECITN